MWRVAASMERKRITSTNGWLDSGDDPSFRRPRLRWAGPRSWTSLRAERPCMGPGRGGIDARASAIDARLSRVAWVAPGVVPPVSRVLGSRWQPAA